MEHLLKSIEICTELKDFLGKNNLSGVVMDAIFFLLYQHGLWYL